MEKSKTTDFKIAAFFGSPHGSGYSSRMHDAFLLNFSRTNIARISAYKRNVRPCIACGFCKTEFRCAFDDMDEIFTAIIDADILTFSWPVYFSSVPSPMKAVIDRLQPVWEASFAGKPRVSGKKIFYFLTSGSDYPSVFGPSLTMLKYVAATMNSEVRDDFSVKLPALDTYDGQKNFDKELNKLKSESFLI